MMRLQVFYKLMVILILTSMLISTTGCNGEYKRFSAREGHTRITCYYPSDFTQVHEGNHVRNFFDNFLPEHFPIAFYHVTGELTHDAVIYISKYEGYTTIESVKQLVLDYTGSTDKILGESTITISGITATKLTIWRDTVALWKPGYSYPEGSSGNFLAIWFEESPTIDEHMFLEYNNEIWEITIAYNESKQDQFQPDFDYFIQTFKIWS